MLESELRGRITTLLGGRSAEELIFGEVSTGASDDIQKATDLAERFVTLYGMSDELGPLAFEKTQQQFLEGWNNPRRAVSPKVAEEIDRSGQRDCRWRAPNGSKHLRAESRLAGRDSPSLVRHRSSGGRTTARATQPRSNSDPYDGMVASRQVWICSSDLIIKRLFNLNQPIPNKFNGLCHSPTQPVKLSLIWFDKVSS